MHINIYTSPLVCLSLFLWRVLTGFYKHGGTTTNRKISLGVCVYRCLVMSNSLRPHELYPTRFLFHGISKARILEWVAIFFSKGSSWPRDWTYVSCIAGRFFIIWATREVPISFPRRSSWPRDQTHVAHVSCWQVNSLPRSTSGKSSNHTAVSKADSCSWYSWRQKQTYTWASQLCTWLQGHPGAGTQSLLCGGTSLMAPTGRPGEHCRGKLSWGESMHLDKAGPSSRLPGWELQAWASRAASPKPRVPLRAPLRAPPGASTWPFLRRHRSRLSRESWDKQTLEVVRLCLQFMVEKHLIHISAVSSNTYQDIFDTLTSRVYRYTLTHVNNFCHSLEK